MATAARTIRSASAFRFRTIVAALGVALTACGGGGSSASSSPSTAAPAGPTDETTGAEAGRLTTYDFEDDVLACMPGSTTTPAAALSPCPETGSLAAAIRERVRSTYAALGSGCSGSGRIVVRISIGADGTATSAEVTSGELDPAMTTRILDALRAVTYCPTHDGSSLVVNYPILVQPGE